MSLFMHIFMMIATVGTILNAAVAYRRSNLEAAIAWAVSALFALSLSLTHLSAYLKSIT
jgi:hypothetical protein